MLDGWFMNEIESYIFEGEEVAITSLTDICCDGGSGSLGHPLEYMAVSTGGEVTCKYCDRRYLHIAHPLVDRVRREGQRLNADGQLEPSSQAA